MTTPVSFEIAKLLKEKRFRQKECPSYLLVDFSQTNTFKTNPENIGIGDLIGYYVPNKTVNAPTIAEVVMWLYEKHGIWISVTTQVTSEFQMVFTAFRPSIKLVFHSDPSKPYNSPTEAYEAAIEHYLINLI